MIAVQFHPAALAELSHEVLYYRDIAPALGQRFAAAVRQAVQLVSELPLAGAPYRHGTRRVFLRRFPFALVYVVRENEAQVLALAAFKRKPGYWRGRLPAR